MKLMTNNAINNKLKSLIDKVNNDLALETYELLEQQKNPEVLDDEIAYTKGIVTTLGWTIIELKKLMEWIENQPDQSELRSVLKEKVGMIEH